MSLAIGDQIGCLTVLEVLEAAQARERGLRTKTGKVLPSSADGAQVLVRCVCLLEFIVRARELSRKKKAERCGSKCELGKTTREVPEHFWTHCRNPLCAKELNPGGMGRPNRTGFCQPCKSERVVSRWYVRTRPDYAETTAARIKHDQQVRAQLKARGLCVQCGLVAPVRGILCEFHRTRVNEKATMRRARCMRAGMCTICKRVAAPGRVRCGPCLKGDAARAAERYWRKTGRAVVAA